MQYHDGYRMRRCAGLRCKMVVSVMMLVALTLTGCSDKTTVSGTPPPENKRATIRVPQDQPTIQAAIDVAGVGDTVLVAPGIYSGEGNRDIELGGLSLVLASEGGPAQTVIALGGSNTDPHRAFQFNTATGPGLQVDGFTLSDGFASSGGAIWMRSSSPVFRNCIFIGNVSETSGGAVRCKFSSPVFKNCTFVSNESALGGALFCLAGSNPRFDNCIVAYGEGGGSVVCSGNEDLPVFECCNIFGNLGGDWNEDIDSLSSLNGNLSIDPLFCNLNAGDVFLQEQSPCSPTGNSCGERIGALGVSVCSSTASVSER